MHFANDIPLDLARAAHAGTSFDPEKRAETERAGYAATLAADLAALERYATTDAKRATLATEFARYRDGYRRLFVAYLASRSRCMSTMITGPSNFPVRRQARINAVADARSARLTEYRERALAAIKKALTPELQPIMAGDSDAVVRLREKIAKLERDQERMKAINATIRKHAKAGHRAQWQALVDLGLAPGAADSLLEPDFCGRIGFPSYALTNNSAEIRRLKVRLAQVETAKEQEPTVTEGASARMEDCPAENRVRLFYPGKPAAEVRARLKASGFRWAPTLGCWQAYRNPNTLAFAARELEA